MCRSGQGTLADSVWVLVMFDMPVQTKTQRKYATKYRNMLLDQGFTMVQFSIYAKYLINATGLRSMLPLLKLQIPDEGEVRIFKLTDEQWAGAYRFFGPREIGQEPEPPLLTLFD